MNQSLADIIDLRELGGDYLRIRQSVRAGCHTAVFTQSKSERALIAWGIDRPLIYVCCDRVKAMECYDRLSYYTDKAVLLIERDDLLMYRKVNSHTNNVNRIKALSEFASGKANILITTAEAVLQFYPNKSIINSAEFTIKTAENIDLDELINRLNKLGYNRVDVVEDKGDFAVHGDIVSVFPIDRESAVRISLFDDCVESIKEYDIDSMKSTQTIESVNLYAFADNLLSDIDLDRIIATVKKESIGLSDNAKLRQKEIIADIKQRLEVNGRAAINWLLPYAIDKQIGIEEYLPENGIMVFDEPKAISDHVKLYHNDFMNRHAKLLAEGEVTVEHKKNIRNTEVLSKIAEKFTAISFAVMQSSNSIIVPNKIFNLKSVPISSYYANFVSIFKDIKNFCIDGYRVVLCCGDEYTAKSIKDSLYDNGIFATYTDNIKESFKQGVVVTPFEFGYGINVRSAKLIIIGKHELLRRVETRKVSQKKRNAFTMPKLGDYVVHDNYGIGIYAGVEQLQTFGIKRDFLVINYAGTDKLYVPVDAVDKLQRFSGSDVTPRLNKLGSKEFQKLKAKVKESVKEMAFDLLELYSKRQNSKGFKYSPDTPWQKEFEEAFEFTETDDQLNAIREIKADMERGIVMDRLLCGDVGYGKTEVALRAVFKTVMDGKQAAILAPTTILAKQHFITASKRFADSGIKCAILSRFQSKEEIKRSLEQIKTGQVSVVIATHRLLSQDVVFNDLGLLVLDEEQRFGVEHKEKLKALKNNINVLTLSATPIPRTLNMALTGIRDISVLETPPKMRLPVETYVTEMSDNLLADALNRELDRDGQAFVLYNRVDKIHGIAENVQRLVPHAKVVVGHGQMNDSELENVINKFYNKEANVLVSTTIIENGLDLPDANTLIVYDADRLGLSALYQLRGRVGRSDKLAYAYFTTRQGKVLTEDALKRLTAIMDYTEFGSGFKIAMRDLEIRGAGNVLGKEQHGHIAKVGYDMYCKLLREAVDEINGGDTIESYNVELKVDVDAYLDDNYISSADDKIKIYKQIGELSDLEDKEKLLQTLRDSYGEPNLGLINLIDLALIKNMAGAIGVKTVMINDKGAGLIFTERVFRNERVICTIADMANDCVLSVKDNPILVFNVANTDIQGKIKVILEFLKKTVK